MGARVLINGTRYEIGQDEKRAAALRVILALLRCALATRAGLALIVRNKISFLPSFGLAQQKIDCHLSPPAATRSFLRCRIGTASCYLHLGAAVRRSAGLKREQRSATGSPPRPRTDRE